MIEPNEKNLKVDPEFKKLIPPLTKEEYAELERNVISANGCRDALTVWNGVIVDGHNRREICERHGLPFEVSRVSFANREEAALWIIENQLGRRNLTDAARIELALSKAELLKAKAKRNMSFGGKRDASVPAPEAVNVRKAVASDAGVCEQTVHKYMKIREANERELLEKVKSGEMKIGTAHRELVLETTTVKKVEVKNTAVNSAGLRLKEILLGNIAEISKTYRFVGEVRATEGIARDSAAIRRIGGHLSVIERIIKLIGA